MHGRAAEERAKEERRAQRAAGDFAAMLRHHRSVHADMTWDEATTALSGLPEWGAVHDEQQRRVLFDEAIERLQAKRERSKRKVAGGCGKDMDVVFCSNTLFLDACIEHTYIHVAMYAASCTEG